MPTLDWLNREAAFRSADAVPTRVLRPHSAGHAFGDAAGAAGQGNLLIQGDNLEHSQRPSMMLPRLQLLRELLREDGSIWVTIDDEGHYLKVMMDEVFGRGTTWRPFYGSTECSQGRAVFAMIYELERGMTMAQQIEAALASPSQHHH